MVQGQACVNIPVCEYICVCLLFFLMLEDEVEEMKEDLAESI